MRSSVVGVAVVAAVLFLVQGCGKKEGGEAPAPAPAAAPMAAEPVPESAPAEAATVATAPAPAGVDGAKVFATYCTTCHGAGGRGDGPAAAGLNPRPADFVARAFRFDANGNGTKGDVDDIQVIVHDGAARHGGSPLMTAWPMLSAEQLQAVAEHVRSLGAG